MEKVFRKYMKVVIFAGGIGTRLWPLSRKNTPKQFEKIIGNKSMLQQTVERISSMVSPEDIYVATGRRYETVVTEQLPQVPRENFIFEPEMRNVGPAIGLAAAILTKRFGDTPMAILWSDHLVKHEDVFKEALKHAEELVSQKKADFVFIGQRPRFANQNIGWIEIGEKVETEEKTTLYKFKSLRYHPALEEAESFFQSDRFVWNLGYFVTTPNYLLSLYEDHVPDMYRSLLRIQQAYETGAFEEAVGEIYPTLEKVSFDDAILTKIHKEKIFVISEDIGWSDVGAWEALKEALSTNEDENVTYGKVLIEDSRDTLAYNYTGQLVVGIDLDQILVVNTPDVLLICPKQSVPKIKKIVESLAGTPHEDLA